MTDYPVKPQNGLSLMPMLIVAALAIGCIGVQSSGALWPDSPLYLNAALMFRDWLQSDFLFRPYEFATLRYAQYPAFHIPFHPPVYPGLLSIWFMIFGPSYLSARIFVALCFGIAGCIFFAILGRLGVSRRDAFFCSLLMLSFPELAMWARDTVSEIPALMFQLAATYFFVRWLDNGRLLFCLAAFMFAEAAFLTRVSSVGIIPIWVLIGVLGGRGRSLLSTPFIASTAAYLALNIAWVTFVARFARFELGQIEQADPVIRTFAEFAGSQLEIVWFYLSSLPFMIGVSTTLLAVVCIVLAFRSREWKVSRVFWLSWLAGSFALILALGAFPERRYFVFVLPAFAALIASAISRNTNNSLGRAWLAVVSVAIVANIFQMLPMPRGVVGYDPIAKYLAESKTPGNILSVTWQGQDLIYRYQANNPTIKRDIIRGDRTLAIRVSKYGGLSGAVDIPTTQLVKTEAEFLDTVTKGRARFLITYLPNDPETPMLTDEMALAHKFASSLTSEFALVSRGPLVTDLAEGGDRGEIFLWEYLKELPEGPNELPVLVPTAGIEMKRGS